MALCQYTRAVGKNHVNHFDTMLYRVIFQLNCCERNWERKKTWDWTCFVSEFFFCCCRWIVYHLIKSTELSQHEHEHENRLMRNVCNFQLVTSFPCCHVLESFGAICFVLNYVSVCLFVCLLLFSLPNFFHGTVGCEQSPFFYKAINFVVSSSFSYFLHLFEWNYNELSFLSLFFCPFRNCN